MIPIFKWNVPNSTDGVYYSGDDTVPSVNDHQRADLSCQLVRRWIGDQLTHT